MSEDITIPAAHMKNAQAWAAFNLPARLRPLYEAVEAKRITSKVLYRDLDILAIDSDLGCVVIFFDPVDSTGPAGFDAKLLADLVDAAAAVVVITAFDDPSPYSWSVEAAVRSGGIVLVAETVDGSAQAWLDLAKRAKGDAHWLLWSSATEGRA